MLCSAHMGVTFAPTNNVPVALMLEVYARFKEHRPRHILEYASGTVFLEYQP